ncbi:MAG: hypothetical protein FJ280_32665 [Planctomycetes bacterium]|nr:hypothetical protein [Planctomycetota bacterium]
MAVRRAVENPILRPEDVVPSRGDFEIIGVSNAAVARYGNEVILLLRVAERPVGGDANVVLCPIYEVEAGRIVVRPFARDDPRYDFSDPRLIVARASLVSRASCPRVSKASRLRSAGGTPAMDYERTGFFGNVVFSCGLLFEEETLKVYYGAADTSIAYAEVPLADVYANLNL